MPKLGETPLLHQEAVVLDSELGRYVEIGEGTRVLESTIGDYSYTARFSDIAYSRLAKFVDVAAFTRINPGEHPYHRALCITSCIAPATSGLTNKTKPVFSSGAGSF